MNQQHQSPKEGERRIVDMDTDNNHQRNHSNNGNGNGNNDEALSPPTVVCETCGKEISTLSVLVHQARCHETNRRSVPSVQQRGQQQRQHNHVQEEDHRHPSSTSSHHHEPSSSPSSSSSSSAPEPPPPPPTPPHESRNDARPTATPSPSPSPSPSQHQRQQWSCPRCTLLNPRMEYQCEVCGYTRQRNEPTRSLSSSSNNNNNNNNNDANNDTNHDTNHPNNVPASSWSSGDIQVQVYEINPTVARAAAGAVSVASWTLLGGLVGGPLGAMVGGTTAALLAGSRAIQQQQQQQQQQRPSTSTTNDERSREIRDRNRHNFITFTSSRVHRAPDGSVVHTITTNGDRDRDDPGRRMRTVVVRVPSTPPHHDDAMMTTTTTTTTMNTADERILQMLLHHAHRTASLQNYHGGIDANVEHVPYEELLERFGVGNEHRRGASPETIRSIPSMKISDQATIEGMPDHQRTCNICLEDFTVGDRVRKLVHCTHAFHAKCLDRWLERVASCPICKTPVSDDDDDGDDDNHNHDSNNDISSASSPRRDSTTERES